MGVDNCMLQGCLIGAQPVFVVVGLLYWWDAVTVHLSSIESEPRDAGTDQKSSGIIRLHTIKQIIDRVSKTRYNTHEIQIKVSIDRFCFC